MHSSLAEGFPVRSALKHFGSLQSHAMAKQEQPPLEREYSQQEIVQALKKMWDENQRTNQRMEELEKEVARAAHATHSEQNVLCKRVEGCETWNENLEERVTKLEENNEFWRDTMNWIWSAFAPCINRYSKGSSRHGVQAAGDNGDHMMVGDGSA